MSSTPRTTGKTRTPSGPVISVNHPPRGIDVVREKIKGFAKQKVKLPPGLHKIIILDEADSLTQGAQQALRMIISDFSSTTRFVLSCNDSAKIIDAIQSRCAILRFTKLNDKSVRTNPLGYPFLFIPI